MLGRTSAVLVALGVAAAVLPRSAPALPDRRPNVVLIVSDDQPPGSLPHDPPAMPYLQGRMEDPSDHWVTFPNAFLNTPLCCPSRATLLTGRYSHRTGVLTNDDGHLLDESSTLAVWLHGAGYFTGLVGKYLNRYPFGRGPYVPLGWDRWAGKMQGGGSSVYYDYTLVEQGFPVPYGSGPEDYSTDVITARAVEFIRTAPQDRPFFLEITPTAPHSPWIPAPRDAGAYASMPVAEPPSVGEEDVSDKPAWIRGLPELGPAVRAVLDQDRRRAYEALRAVDDAVRRVVEALRDRGELEDTVILYLTDNGFSFGEHRWVGKQCPYEECIRTPFLVRYPGATSRADGHLVSNVDVAPTVADLAGISPGLPADGRSLVPLLEGSAPAGWREGVLLEWTGDPLVPAWWGVRTEDLSYVEYATGERELYDLTGTAGPPDPFQLDDRADDPAYAALRAELAALLERLRGG
ncbi:MAG: sulfatase [Actinobacteria bacterium]|nr:sulfatase [Actinomycetota bacterium]